MSTFEVRYVHEKNCPPELWVGTLDKDGIWMPLPGTGPAPVPMGWRKAIETFKDAQE